MKFNRIFIIVLDSLGIGELPDADMFQDKGSNTLRSISMSPYFNCPNLEKLGLFRIDGIDFKYSEPVCNAPIGVYARLAEQSMGKDTTTGHWEIAGLISKQPFPTYPNGFPKNILEKFSKETGRGVLCNQPYSGTKVIEDYGEEHFKTGNLIVYTSADSVFQIAAHENLVPVKQLYEYCQVARKILNGEHAVGRVIARPFAGEPGHFYRTPNRRDFSLNPPQKTVLNLLREKGFDTISVGKIFDIFNGCGITEKHTTHGNEEGIQAAAEIVKKDFNGLCFVNLVDFDMLYGHRNDVDGYARTISEFDKWLGNFIKLLRQNDLLLITGDHGCDPATPSTDHSREYTPLLAYHPLVTVKNLGIRKSFADIGKTVAENFSVDTHNDLAGESFLGEL